MKSSATYHNIRRQDKVNLFATSGRTMENKHKGRASIQAVVLMLSSISILVIGILIQRGIFPYNTKDAVSIGSTKKIILIGETGVGKSTFGNTLLGEDIFEVGHTLDSCTETVQTAEGFLFGNEGIGVKVSVSDSGGLGDTEGRDEDFVNEITNHIRSIDGVHGFLFVMNACERRFDRQSRDALRFLIKAITINKERQSEIGTRLAFVMTHCSSPTHRLLWGGLPEKVCDVTGVCGTDMAIHWFDDLEQNRLWPWKSWLVWGASPSIVNDFLKKEPSWRDKFLSWLLKLDDHPFQVPHQAEVEEQVVLQKQRDDNMKNLLQRLKDDLQSARENMSFMKDGKKKIADDMHDIKRQINEIERELWKDEGSCFSGSSQVIDRKLGHVMMKDLRVGSEIKVESGHFSKVTAFMHYHPEKSTQALQITHSEGSLTITSNHLVFVVDMNGKKHTVTAAQLSPGDTLLTEQNFSIVEDIKPLMIQGYYAPITSSGTIIVDGIVASCYTRHNDLQLPHWVLHLLAAPLRLPFFSPTPLAGQLHEAIKQPIRMIDKLYSMFSRGISN